jgi:HlyD family secretion protein
MGLAGLAVVFHVRPSSVPAIAEASGSTPAVDPGAADDTSSAVAALGRIEPQSEIINIGAGAAPNRLDSLFVGRGDVVSQGQLLGYLSGYAEQVAQQEMFSAQLDEAKRRLEAETAMNLALIQQAEIRQREALEITPLKISAQASQVERLEAALANDRDVLATQLELYRNGNTTRRLRDDRQTLVRQDESDLSAARAHLVELRQQFELDKIDADIAVRLAKATLERAQAEIPLTSLEKQMKLAHARAEELALYAPVAGRILNIVVKPGEQVANGPILTMGDTTKMRAVAEVYETDITRVRLGQTATVTSRALSHPITGRVVRIGHMVFKNDVLNIDPAARADARVVEVWIELDEVSVLQRLTNLTVDVLIATPPSSRGGADPTKTVAR